MPDSNSRNPRCCRRLGPPTPQTVRTSNKASSPRRWARTSHRASAAMTAHRWPCRSPCDHSDHGLPAYIGKKIINKSAGE